MPDEEKTKPAETAMEPKTETKDPSREEPPIVIGDGSSVWIQGATPIQMLRTKRSEAQKRLVEVGKPEWDDPDHPISHPKFDKDVECPFAVTVELEPKDIVIKVEADSNSVTVYVDGRDDFEFDTNDNRHKTKDKKQKVKRIAVSCNGKMIWVGHANAVAVYDRVRAPLSATETVEAPDEAKAGALR
jgi:hypothetical protein